MSSLVKITDEIFVRKSEIMAIELSCSDDCISVIKMKHDVDIHVPVLLPKQIMDILDADTVRPLK